jgi:hypothetical protein
MGWDSGSPSGERVAVEPSGGPPNPRFTLVNRMFRAKWRPVIARADLGVVESERDALIVLGVYRCLTGRLRRVLQHDGLTGAREVSREAVQGKERGRCVVKDMG